MNESYENIEFKDIKNPVTFTDYMKRKRSLANELTKEQPYAILLVGKTGPIHQILVRQDGGAYVIKYEGNKFSGGATYTITTGRLSRNPQPIEKIVNKIVDANFSGYTIKSPQVLMDLVHGDIDQEELPEV